jgi:DNA polymerase
VQQAAAARRRKPVFGAGDLRTDWLCVGDPPLEDEERQGLPFAGDAGRLLDNMLAAVGASRTRGAYLTNVLKWRLPEDRSREAEEVAQSLAFLRRQVQLLQPKVVLAMGRYAVQALLQSGEPIGKLRGAVHRFAGVPVVVTYHPAYLLRTLPDKGKAWADLCLAQALVRGEG